MDPNEFVKILSENGQIPSMVGEVARNKALAIILGKVKVVDTEGKAVDLSEFVAVPGDEDEAAEGDAAEAPAEEAPAEEAAAEEKPKKKSTSRKKKADEE
jgi:trigger factor